MKRTVFLFLLIGFLLLGSSNCRKKEFAITGLWDMYWNGSPTPGRFEFSGTAVSGTVLEVGILPSVQYHTYVVDGNQITIKFYMVHGIAWSRRTLYRTDQRGSKSAWPAPILAKAAACRTFRSMIFPEPGRPKKFNKKVGDCRDSQAVR